MTYYETKMKINGSWVTVGPSKTEFDSKLTKNASITGATKCKITYDANGLVTAGADLAAGDIPALAISGITGLQDALDAKQTKVTVVGTTDTPIYVSADGTFSTCSKYAGGTALTLNGTSQASGTATIYAPTTVGSNGQFFGSDGTSTGWKTISSALHFKGTCLFADLPTTGMVNGDTYCVTDKNYHNYSYDGSTFVDIGANIDLSGYQTISMGSGNTDKVMVTSNAGNISVSSITSTELGCLSGLTENISTALSKKQDSLPTTTEDKYLHFNTTSKEIEWAEVSVSKIGTVDVGANTADAIGLMYLSSGTPTAISVNSGSTKKPVYVASGVVKPISDTVGSTSKPVYLNAGEITEISGNIGSKTVSTTAMTMQPVYIDSGTITAGITFSSGTADPSGGSNGDVYFQYE